MATFEPQTPNWLSPSWDEFYQEDPELLDAYGWEDYPSEMAGEGNWIDLFLDSSGKYSVGRLWICPDTQSIGLIQAQNGNATWLTKSALNLRQFNRHDVSVFSAYDYVKNDYYCGEEQTGDLKDAVLKIEAA